MIQKLTALLLLLATFSKPHAATFTITSNADSGPGTLREAITKAKANGTAETDYIYFTITPTDMASRTIVLKTVLPDLSSNVVIDASTQSGTKIGVTDAKIRITAAATTTISYVFRFIDTRNNAVYGFHFDKLVRGIADFTDGYAIQLHNVDGMEVGAPGKGNYFTLINVAVGTTFLQMPGRGVEKNLSLRSNIVNLTEDGSAILDYSFTRFFSLPNIANVTIGGTMPEEGNFIAGNMDYSIVSQMDTIGQLDVGYIKILNNNFGCDVTKTKPLNSGGVLLENLEDYGSTLKGNLSIIGNTFCKLVNAMSFDMYPCYVVHNIKGFIDVRSNRINTLVNLDLWTATAASLGFAIGGCDDGRIGGDDPADKNTIVGCAYSGIVLNNNKAITISKNSIYCNDPGITVLGSVYEVPKTKIFTITDYTVGGTTLPNSKVEVFLTKKCGGCRNGERYLGTVIADGAGNWFFTSPVLLDGSVTATGTSPKGVTGEFAHPEFNIEKLENNYVACGSKDGYIKGMQFVAGTRYYWINRYTNDTLFNKLDLENLGAGMYTFTVEQGKYCNVQHSVTVGDYTPKLYSNDAKLVQPSCNKKNGGIVNIYAGGYYDKIYWKNEAGDLVGDELELYSQGPGRYKLVILNTAHGCGDSTDYFTLTNQSGPSLSTATMKVTAAACGASNGSIQNIKTSNVMGNAAFEWVDADDQVVGRTLDLKNISGGTYRMTLYDDRHCNITTEPIAVGGSSKTTINITNATSTPSQCRYGSGTIKGISVTGATDYIWTNEKGVVVSHDLNPKALLPGSFTLTAGTASGCPKTSAAISVPVDPDMQLDPALQTTITPATCGQPNGSVVLQNFPAGSYTFTWKQPDALAVAATMNLKEVVAGAYTLYATDATGCTQRVTTVAVAAVAPPQLQPGVIKNDVCTQQKGSIQAIRVTDGTAPFTYTWYNQQQVVGTSSNLLNVGSGTYQLKVQDASGCIAQSSSYTIRDETRSFSVPQYPEQLIPRHTSTTLAPQNGEAGTYEWFDDAALTQRLEANNTGVFQTPNLPNDKAYYIRIREGSCNSAVATVIIKVADAANVYVPTAFSPNHDGKNDDLKPIITGIFKLEYFSIYDRWGHVVFKTSDLSKGWNGFNKGLEAPAGTYVWLLKGRDYTGAVIQQKGTVTIVR